MVNKEANRIRITESVKKFFSYLILLLFFSISIVFDVNASDVMTAEEYQIKAAFLYNFAKFVEFPKQSLAPEDREIVIGIIGNDPFGRILDDTVAGKKVDNRGFVIKRFASFDEIKSCHVLFISSSEQGNVAEILKKLDGLGILAVSDFASLPDDGVMINFIVKSNRVKFEINLNAAQKAGIKISSKLLKLAVSVKGNAQSEGVQ